MNALTNHFLNTYGCVYLSWATKISSNPFINFGDELSYFITRHLISAHIPIKHAHFDSKYEKICSIGTILHNFTKGKTYVWGTGFDKCSTKARADLAPLDIFATRGEHTANHLHTLGYPIVKVFGDPGLLINKYIVKPKTPKYKLGIIPHYSNANIVNNRIIDHTFPCFKSNDEAVSIISPKTLSDTMSVLDKILSCEFILSQSIHGCIVADAMGIPNLFYQHDENRKTICANDSYNVEHRYADYITAFPSNKFIYRADRTKPLNFSEVINDISNYYIPIKNLENIQQNLLENHPLLKN